MGKIFGGENVDLGYLLAGFGVKLVGRLAVLALLPGFGDIAFLG